MDQNISQTCRGCLSDVGEEAYSLLSEEIRNLYGSCTKISLPQPGITYDPLPQQICLECYMKCETWSSFKTMCNQSEIQFWVLHSQEQIGEEVEQIVEDVEQIVEEEEEEIVEEEEQIMEEDERIVFDPLDECDDAGMTTEEVEIIEEEENITEPTQETVKMVFAKPVNFKVKDLNDPKKPKKRIRKPGFTGTIFKTLPVDKQETLLKCVYCLNMYRPYTNIEKLRGIVFWFLGPDAQKLVRPGKMMKNTLNNLRKNTNGRSNKHHEQLLEYADSQIHTSFENWLAKLGNEHQPMITSPRPPTPPVLRRILDEVNYQPPPLSEA